MNADPQELLEVAAQLARAAGDLLRQRPAELDASSKSTPTDAVTVMDRAAEKLILDGLRAIRPDDAVVAEESGDSGSQQDAEVRWLVDPLDGTVNYVYDLPQFSVSIAAQVAGSIVAGVVYDVAKDEMFAATTGGGATCNGRAVRVTDETDPALALVATGFSYDADIRAEQAAVLLTLLPRVRDIRRLGSAALDLCALAAGRVDGYFERELKQWDWAAGALVAREAGARVGRVGGGVLGSGGTTLAANPTLYTALEGLLLSSGAGGRAGNGHLTA